MRFYDRRGPEQIEHEVVTLVGQRVFGIAQSQSELVDLFLEAHERAPSEIILDLDATGDPVHGNQEGRFTACTTATVICRSTSSAGSICWQRSCGA